ncbi:uncharacterized protein AB675_11882 [Cyphellophora attinorum]|uniref:Uncharacterized protein n=1 Tax=Cyphellophora attinorum TaxID=1664694 RepID=A0A0N0NJB8_9EURO|nr:uncharacterized protein AB675_11882 [Phialophora attinorum]KPI36801.1 hypothetical protein AB675_11882 [Phialophora attinorum]
MASQLTPILIAQDEPLHTTLLPPHTNSHLDMSFVLNSSLDIFDMRLRHSTSNKIPLTQDLGLLHSISPRLATYGFLTNTNIKFVIVVDMLGRNSTSDTALDDSAEVDAQISAGGTVGLRDADLKPAWKAIQSAWIGLLLNGFYTPDVGGRGRGGQEIKSKKFAREMERIGMAWYMWINWKEGSKGCVKGQEVNENETLANFVGRVKRYWGEPKEDGWFSEVFFRKKALSLVLRECMEEEGLAEHQILVKDYFEGGETVYYKVYDEEGVEHWPWDFRGQVC